MTKKPLPKGKQAEAEFILWVGGFGKNAHLHRVTDAAEVKGMNTTFITSVKSQPADFIVTLNGKMFYAEVKSTLSSRFDFNSIRPFQMGTARRVIAAGGDYFFFVKTPNGWYRVPGKTVVDTLEKGVHSINKLDLIQWEYPLC